MPSSLSHKNYVWLPDSVEILPSGKNQYQLTWFYMGEIFYSDYCFTSKQEALATVENLKSLWIWSTSENKTDIKIPEKLFYELRGKGLSRGL